MSRIDQIVKGAPPPEAQLPDTVTKTPSPSLESGLQDSSTPAASTAPDPLSTLPSSPPQIYLNLLILESSLRSQYLALRARRRHNTFFLLLLTLWIAYFSYALFLRPREDGSGVGGSIYWVVETGEKVALIGGIVTALLVWGTGQWERGLRWPRRWLGVANRGLRNFNAKIVIIRGPWWKELIFSLAFLIPYSPFFSTGPSFHYVERTPAERERRKRRPSIAGRPASHDDDTSTGIEEDLSPGGDHIQLLLLPKSFSPAFRENWDEYRTEYWERENERRARLRTKIEQRERQLAKQEGGWLWWTGWHSWRRRRAANAKAGRDLEKSHHHQHRHHPSNAHHRHTPSRPEREKSRREPHNHSRTSSRSTTPNPLSDMDERPVTPERSRPRRGSSANSPGSERRKSRSSLFTGATGNRALSPLTQIASQDDGRQARAA